MAAAPIPIATPVIVAVVNQRPKQNSRSKRQDTCQKQITPASIPQELELVRHRQ